MIYPGADASFDLYEDEGEGYAYESGAYSIIPLTWHDAASQLHVHARQGSFDGMIERHIFRAVNMAGFGYENYTEAPPVVCGGKA
jgi:alpha-D-xyloside xylohydrolase